MNAIGRILLTVALVAGTSVATHAQESYVSGFGGITFRTDSMNAGALTSAFTTGAGTTIPAGTVLSPGTSLGWDTEFDTGYNLGFAYGMSSGNGFRAEAEARYLRSDVSSHARVAVGGGVIDTEDAGVLITGSPNLGVTVGALVSDGQGKADTWTFMGNAYLDFNPDGTVNPYLGGGLGFATTEFTFAPSGVGVASHRDGGLAYQGIAGVDFRAADQVRVFAEYRYLGRDDLETPLTLLPATLEIEDESHNINFGVRFHF